MGAVETWGALTEFFLVIGLLLDMIGAIMILGPDLPPIARAFTMYERRKLKKLEERIRQGEVITEDDSGFQYLRTAVGQGLVEGPTEKPFKPEPDNPRNFSWKFDVIEGMDDHVKIETIDGNKRGRFQYEDLKEFIENYTARERTYFEVGVFSLMAGFFFQLSQEIAEFSLILSMIFFASVGSVFVYFVFKMNPADDDD